jgi:hypothetical protein
VRLEARDPKRQEPSERRGVLPHRAHVRPGRLRDEVRHGKKHANAFGNCVSQTAKAAAKAQQAATTNAAKACWAERKPDPAAFKAKYGTNANKSNAFGKCVSGKVKHTP